MTRSTQIRLVLPIAAGFARAVPVVAQEEAREITVVPKAEVQWTEIAPGIEFGAIFGNWQAEPHGKLVRFEPGVISPMHQHSRGFHAVVIAGTVINPYEGEETPPQMGPGTYWSTPAGAVHATGCISKEPCVLYSHMNHLWDFEPAEQ